MRLSACLVLLLLAPWPATIVSAGAYDHHEIAVEVRLDRSERTVWRVESPEPVRVLDLPVGADVVAVEGATATRNGSRLEFSPPAHAAQITLERSRPDESLHPLYSLRFPLPTGARVEATVRAPEGFLLFQASQGEIARDGRSLTYAGRGGVELVVAYRSPYDADLGLVEIDEGIYHVVAPARSEAAARRIASIASAASVAAAEHAGLPLPMPIWVRFAPDRAFGDEAGYYGNDGIVAVRREELSTGPLDGHPWRAAETLVHETFHAASLPLGDARLAANVTWWLEGSARFSERFVSGLDGWRACDTGWCVAFQSQLNASQLRSAYDGTFGFLPGWTSHNEARYRHASYLVGTYVDRYGIEAYRAAWADVRAGARSPTCACDEEWLLQILVRHSAGRATRDEIYRPFGDLRQDDRAAFDARVARLVGHEPVNGTPIPWQPLPTTPASPAPTAPLRLLALQPPAVPAPDVFLRARIDGASLLEDPTPPGPPDARLVVRLDGEPAAPSSLVVLDGNVTFAIVNLTPGEHRVEIEAIGLHGMPLEPPLRNSTTFFVEGTYTLAVDRFPPGVHAAPVLLSGVVRGGNGSRAAGDVTVTLRIEGLPDQQDASDPSDGRFYFDVLELPSPEASMRLVVEDAYGRVLGENVVRLPAPPASDPPDAPGLVPAAGVEPEEARGTPSAHAWMAVLVAVLAARLVARRRVERP